MIRRLRFSSFWMGLFEGLAFGGAVGAAVVVAYFVVGLLSHVVKKGVL